MAKCLLDTVRSVGGNRLNTAAALQYPLMFEDQAYRILKIDYGQLPNDIIILIHTQNSCQSPFLGTLVGTATRGLRWLTVALSSKNVIIDQRFDKESYPAGFPSWFQGLPAEDYNVDFCRFICSYHPDVSWQSFFENQLPTCHVQIRPAQYPKMANENTLCSPQDCVPEKTRVSVFTLHDMLRYEDMGKGMAPSAPITEVWVKRSSNFYTKTIRNRKPVSEFVAELGGHLSLWVGASILTVIEIGEFLIHFIVKGWERKTSTRRKVKGELNVELGNITGDYIDSDMVEVNLSERRKNGDSNTSADVTGGDVEAEAEAEAEAEMEAEAEAELEVEAGGIGFFSVEAEAIFRILAEAEAEAEAEAFFRILVEAEAEAEAESKNPNEALCLI